MQTKVLLESLEGAHGLRYDFSPLVTQYFPGLDTDDLVRFALNGYFATIAEREDYARLYSSVTLVLSPHALHALVQTHIDGSMTSDLARVEEIFNANRYQLQLIDGTHYLIERL